MKRAKKRSQKAGLAPGTAVYIGEQKTENIRITIINYDKDAYEMRDIEKIEECVPYREKPAVTWINIEGLHEVAVTEEVGKCFGLHPLTVEDILNMEQRPKVEMFEDYIFFVMKMISFEGQTRNLNIEQVSLVLLKNTVITFQEKGGDVFDAVRTRIKNDKGMIRRAEADYLAYALMDAVVDEYFGIQEKIGDEIEEIEEILLKQPARDTMQKIHALKRKIIYLRKSVWPLREIISALERDGSTFISASTRVYLKDLYDHTIQVIDGVETFRDIISGILDMYLSSLSNRMNEVMKVLTIFASIFIPLTLIAGIYGMNFNVEKSPFNMPELNWYLGYPFALGLMIATALVMLMFFRRKKWI
ncbi:MAG: magnesium and cobalt transport protein CorA [Nitrospiraceae bacterium]|nr:MAG: magnesium and cobalt transport protein CorA [Nitrospiraceae bacterium]